MSLKLTKVEFTTKAKEIHGDKYDYSKVEYLNVGTKVKIICPIHGIFEQRPNDHLSKRGCKYCGIYRRAIIKTSNINVFKLKANLVHENKYDYSISNYNGVKNKIKIICPTHGVFEQTPDNHLRGHGCPICKESKGEVKILNYLIDNNISFNRQHRFKDCKFKKPLVFDFYLPNHNMCIEYDGEQHCKSVKFWGGDVAFKERLIKDKIKTDYCLNKNINLFRITFKDNIYNFLNELFTIEYL